MGSTVSDQSTVMHVNRDVRLATHVAIKKMTNMSGNVY